MGGAEPASGKFTPGAAWLNSTSSSGCGYGSGFKRMPLITLKIALLARIADRQNEGGYGGEHRRPGKPPENKPE
jgi:hypothetical protein